MKCNTSSDSHVWVATIALQVLKHIAYPCCDIGYHIADASLRKISVMSTPIVKIVHVVYEYVPAANKEAKQ